MANTRTVTIGTPADSEGVSCEAPAGYGLFCVVMLGIYMLNHSALVPALIIYTFVVVAFHVAVRIAVYRARRRNHTFPIIPQKAVR